ncbi:hypothetical protein ACFWD7_27080 [Streptomyces mirabilis]|uniref:hypothetical protein n=1 Tax=Streptomyces mirabilis TaxID=68239 RepID=UPI0021C15F0B|nr:hypothetical protein [Streptomyces mirabilis]MCT9109588.1 hypothetical protein [Streptomyces mirabilis]
MDIPDWFVWIFLGLAVLQILGLVPTIRRLRGLDSAVRFKARLDLLDAVGNLLLMAGLVLSLVVAESWFWLAFAGIALMAAIYAVKGVHRLRARRRPTA